jgi:periplasmic protein TonB
MARLLPRFPSNDSPDSHLIHRVADNLRAAFLLPKYVRSSSNSAPLHFADVELSARRGPAQAYAAIVHATLLCAILLLWNSPHNPIRTNHFGAVDTSKISLRMPQLLEATGFGKPSLGPEGGSGNNDLRPPTHGNLAPLSSMPLGPPHLPQSQEAQLPVPPAVFDPNAPATVPVVTKLGLPWMKDDSDSSGSGKGHGIGTGNGDGMGDGNGSGEGDGGTGPYANVLSPVVCTYCPEPPYTEEARKLKLQGNITVSVLVGVDGRAQKIRIVKGLGQGLDEQTIASIRAWRFTPALDAHHNPVPVWVTIETAFRLI